LEEVKAAKVRHELVALELLIVRLSTTILLWVRVSLLLLAQDQ
jgi:hypothetical protein